jgi:hypothetical protein
MEPFRQAANSTCLSLLGMNREQAQRERERMAAEHPEVTWLVAEQEGGEWAVVKVGLPPSDGPEGAATEARPKPDYAGDPRSSQVQNAPYGNF